MFVGGHTRKIMGVTVTPGRMASASPHKFLGGITVPDPHLEEIAHSLDGIEKEMRIANRLKVAELYLNDGLRSENSSTHWVDIGEKYFLLIGEQIDSTLIH